MRCPWTRWALFALVVASLGVTAFGIVGLASPAPEAVVLGAGSSRSTSGGLGYVQPREAMYWEKLDGGRVRCSLCPRRCVVAPGGRGYCEVRENIDGVYYTLTYGNPCAVHVDPIEKKPFYHFLPTTTAFSIATAGCNLDCKFCQNWQISQARPEATQNNALSPEDIVALAAENDCPSIAYTYSEPTIFYEYMLDCAKLAHERGIRNVYHSNGYINAEPLRELCGYLDAANIDLKGFSDDYYRELSSGRLAPVLESLKILRESGVHLELTTLVVPGHNDDPQMTRAMCRWIREELGDSVPLHFSRFSPRYRLLNLPPTPLETLEAARRIALEEGLEHVYIGNVPGHEANSTYCPNCGALLIRRIGYSVREEGIEDGVCLRCGEGIEGVWK